MALNEEAKEKMRQYYKRNRETILSQNTNWANTHRDVVKQIATRHRNKRRAEILHILGDKCAKCGFSDPRALQIDHVNGGGVKERKRISWIGIHRKILNGNTTDYQLLCANCNWIKRSENSEL
jgi:hypothetical protein